MSEAIQNLVRLNLSETFGKKVKILHSENIGGGCINHASKLLTSAGTFFLKWNARCPSNMFKLEAESLSELRKAAADSIIIPNPLCVKDCDDTPGFIVLEFLEPGHSGLEDEKLGQGLAAIHRFRGEYFGYRTNNYCGDTLQDNTPEMNWPEFFGKHRLGPLLQLIDSKRGLSSGEMNVYELLQKRLPELLPADSVPVLIHGDLWSGNYLFTKRGPALIDPAAYYAEREMEFAIITMFGGFTSRFFDAYNEAFPLDQQWRERNPLYQLYHLLNHDLLFGGGYAAQALNIAKSYL